MAEFIADQGSAVLMAVTAVLALFALATRLSVQPAWRQRCAEVGTMLALIATVFMVLQDNQALHGSVGVENGEATRSARANPTVEPLPVVDGAALSQLPITSRPLAGREALDHSEVVSLRASIARISQSINDETKSLQRAQGLGLAWLIGSVFSLVWLGFGCRQLRHVLKSSHAAPPKLRALWTDKVGGAPGVRILVHDGDIGPFCAGLFRPVVVLSESLLSSGSDAAVLSVLRHENVHLQRRDLVGHCIFRAARVVLWFHPLMWWMESQAREAAELVADDLAATEGASRPEYARSLLELAEAIPTPTRLSVSLPSLLRSRSQLSRRIEMLLSRRTPWRKRLGAKASLVLCLCAVSAWSLGTQFAPRLGAQTPSEKDSVQELRDRQADLRRRLKNLDRRIRASSGGGANPVVPGTAFGDSLGSSALSKDKVGDPFGNSNFVTYEVQPGDTVISVMRRHGLTVKDLGVFRKLNADLDEKNLKVGQQIALPRVRRNFARGVSSGPFGVAKNPGAVTTSRSARVGSTAGQQAGPSGPRGFRSRGNRAAISQPVEGQSNGLSTGTSVGGQVRPSRRSGGQASGPSGPVMSLGGGSGGPLATSPPVASRGTNQEPALGTGSVVNSDNVLFLMLERVIDSEAQVDILRTQLERTAQLAKRGSASSADVRPLEIKLRAAKSKLRLARNFVKAEQEVTAQALVRIKTRMKAVKKTASLYGVLESQMMKLKHRLSLMN